MNNEYAVTFCLHIEVPDTCMQKQGGEESHIRNR
jgi:hypothetical protein